MKSKNLTKEELAHMQAVKGLPCGVCGAAPPSDCHHIMQGKHYLCIPLCKSCHQSSHNGIHQNKHIWKVLKKTEMSVLNDTIFLCLPSEQLHFHAKHLS